MACIVIFIKFFYSSKNNLGWILRAPNLCLILITAIWILIFDYFVFRSTLFRISVTLIPRLLRCLLFLLWYLRNDTLTWWAFNSLWVVLYRKIIHLTFLIWIFTLKLHNTLIWINWLSWYFLKFYSFLEWVLITIWRICIVLFVLNIWRILTLITWICNCPALRLSRSFFWNIWWNGWFTLRRTLKRVCISLFILIIIYTSFKCLSIVLFQF